MGKQHSHSAAASTGSILRAAATKIALAAQAVYEDWEQDEEGMSDEYGAGGICDTIAERIVMALDAADIEAMTVHDDSANHTYAMAKFPDGIYAVDIPCRVYETGTFYRYKKRPDVSIEAEDVVWDKVFGEDELYRWDEIVEG